MNEVYYGAFLQEFTISMLQKIIVLIWDYIHIIYIFMKTTQKLTNTLKPKYNNHFGDKGFVVFIDSRQIVDIKKTCV